MVAPHGPHALSTFHSDICHVLCIPFLVETILKQHQASKSHLLITSTITYWITLDPFGTTHGFTMFHHGARSWKASVAERPRKQRKRKPSSPRSTRVGILRGDLLNEHEWNKSFQASHPIEIIRNIFIKDAQLIIIMPVYIQVVQVKVVRSLYRKSRDRQDWGANPNLPQSWGSSQKRWNELIRNNYSYAHSSCCVCQNKRRNALSVGWFICRKKPISGSFRPTLSCLLGPDSLSGQK